MDRHPPRPTPQRPRPLVADAGRDVALLDGKNGRLPFQPTTLRRRDTSSPAVDAPTARLAIGGYPCAKAADEHQDDVLNTEDHPAAVVASGAQLGEGAGTQLAEPGFVGANRRLSLVSRSWRSLQSSSLAYSGGFAARSSRGDSGNSRAWPGIGFAVVWPKSGLGS